VYLELQNSLKYFRYQTLCLANLLPTFMGTCFSFKQHATTPPVVQTLDTSLSMIRKPPFSSRTDITIDLLLIENVNSRLQVLCANLRCYLLKFKIRAFMIWKNYVLLEFERIKYKTVIELKRLGRTTARSYIEGFDTFCKPSLYLFFQR
jgi:hypothetical protein